MISLRAATIVLVAFGATPAFADELLYRYEADVLPYDPSAGWINGSPCRENDGCVESLQDGHLILYWADSGDIVGYGLWIATPEDPPPPPSLWVEWRYRSDQAFTGSSIYCDGLFNVHYGEIHEPLTMFGDAAFSFSGDDFVIGLDIDEFHSYRFESLDGVLFRVSVDGVAFITSGDFSGNGYHFLGFGGEAGCLPLPTTNEWDFVRYGTISFGEKIVAADPPGGFLDPGRYPSLDRFTVTFDSPNYVYIDDITVKVADSLSSLNQENLCPSVIQTRRLDNGDPEVVEIVLDRPIPTDGRTVFTLSDGVAINTVQYTYIQGDVNADGAFDLADLAEWGNCFGLESPTGRCYAFDFDDNGLISLSDYAILHGLLTGP